MLEDFTYGEYRDLLTLLKTGRTNMRFSDFRNSEIPLSFFILRHDVDFSLTAALNMARVESDMQLRATYFLLLDSPNYNLLSHGCCSVPRQLVSMGHEVGLHYDVQALLERDGAAMRMQLQYEIDILEGITGNPIVSIAMHNPSSYGNDPFADDKNFINAYDPRFTKAIAYFSDSCGAWRNSAYNVFQDANIPDKLQILFHPFYWAETVGNRLERLDKWVDETYNAMEERREQILKVWYGHIGVEEHDNRTTKSST